jgi:hypothetical protein
MFVKYPTTDYRTIFFFWGGGGRCRKVSRRPTFCYTPSERLDSQIWIGNLHKCLPSAQCPPQANNPAKLIASKRCTVAANFFHRLLLRRCVFFASSSISHSPSTRLTDPGSVVVNGFYAKTVALEGVLSSY